MLQHNGFLAPTSAPRNTILPQLDSILELKCKKWTRTKKRRTKRLNDIPLKTAATAAGRVHYLPLTPYQTSPHKSPSLPPPPHHSMLLNYQLSTHRCCPASHCCLFSKTVFCDFESFSWLFFGEKKGLPLQGGGFVNDVLFSPALLGSGCEKDEYFLGKPQPLLFWHAESVWGSLRIIGQFVTLSYS